MDTTNRVAIFVKEIEDVLIKLNSFYGTPFIELGELGEEEYTRAWLTKELVLVKLRLSLGSFTLEITQCEKLSSYKKFFYKCKFKINDIFKKISNN